MEPTTQVLDNELRRIAAEQNWGGPTAATLMLMRAAYQAGESAAEADLAAANAVCDLAVRHRDEAEARAGKPLASGWWLDEPGYVGFCHRKPHEGGVPCIVVATEVTDEARD